MRPLQRIGNLSILEAACKDNPGNPGFLDLQYRNNITMRSSMMLEEMRSKQASNTLEEAHIKALRLYRRFCRLVPFIIRNNWLQYKTTPALAKQQLALQFRIYARTTDIEEIDTAIAEGYEQMLNMEQVYVEPAGCFIELAPKERHRDTGYSFFDQRFAKNNKKASGFLTDFYKLTKDPDS